MKQASIRSYCILGAGLFLALCMPQKGADILRCGFVSFSIPLYKSAFFLMHSAPALGVASTSQMETLQLENLTLQTQIDRVYNWLTQEEHLEGLSEKERMTQQRVETVKQELLQQSQFLPAQVIFREPASWSSFIWIDVGQKENERIGFDLVAQNSPVVAGSALIGVVEYVGKNRSKVRLITDNAFTPSIIGARGKLQQRFLHEQIDPLLRILPLQEKLFGSKEDCQRCIDLLSQVQNQLVKKDFKLSKGFVEGLSEPLWRACHQKLKGVGFRQKEIADFEEGDLLLTSGLDGVFPEGLKVGVVSQVFPSRKGDPTYAFEAELACAKINELMTVQVIPPCR